MSRQRGRGKRQYIITFTDPVEKRLISAFYKGRSVVVEATSTVTGEKEELFVIQRARGWKDTALQIAEELELRTGRTVLGRRLT